MGGDEDGGGCVDADMLIRTIKEKFEMTIDIEKLIREVDEDGSGEIEFDEF
jgi:Ca2+-binding EF-hand superfamily protein